MHKFNLNVFRVQKRKEKETDPVFFRELTRQKSSFLAVLFLIFCLMYIF